MPTANGWNCWPWCAASKPCAAVARDAGHSQQVRQPRPDLRAGGVAANDWQWEHYGEMVPVKNRDLWQRVDRALRFHQLECRTWRFDLPHLAADDAAAAHATPRRVGRRRCAAAALRGRLKRKLAGRCERVVGRPPARGWGCGVAQCGTRLLPLPWLAISSSSLRFAFCSALAEAAELPLDLISPRLDNQ